MENKRVIIADTDGMARHQLAQTIQQTQGLAVAGETGDGRELLALCSRAQCDIVVMELVLSTMDGLEVLEGLASLPCKPMVIVLSGFLVDWIAKLSRERGADYLMLKPCKADSVVARIQQMLQLTPADRQLAQNTELKMAVTAAIHEIGIPSHIKGYQYLRDAIMLAVMDMEAVDSITKILYPRIAKNYSTTSCGVERAIRHAIELAWERGDAATIQRIFGYTINSGKGKPTNSEFISLIADRLQLEMMAKW